jgi:WD40 repeat protein
VAISPDGKRILSLGGDGIRIWDAATLLQQARIELAGCMAVTPDWKTLATRDKDRVIRIWDYSGEQPRRLAVLRNREWSALCMALTPDGKTLAVTDGGPLTRLLDLSGTGPTEQDFIRKEDFGGEQVAFSPDGRILAENGTKKRMVRLWDVIAGQLRFRATLEDCDFPVTFSPDGKALAVFNRGMAAVQLWDISGAKVEKGRLLQGDMIGLTSITFSPDSRLLVCALGSRRAQFWPLDEAKGKELRLTLQPGSPHMTVDLPFSADQVRFFPDGKRLLFGGDGLRVWDLAESQERSVLRGHASAVLTLAFAPDCKSLASGGGDFTVRWWDLTGPKPKERAVLQHKGIVEDLAFAPDGRTLASCAGERADQKDNTVRFWDLTGPTVRERLAFQPYFKEVRRLDFSPDGKLLATDGRDYVATGEGHRSHVAVRLWDCTGARPRERAIFPPLAADRLDDPKQVKPVRFSPDGKLVAFRDHDKAHLWDVSDRSPKEWAVLKGSQPFEEVWTVGFGPDGKTLITAGEADFSGTSGSITPPLPYGTVRSWDLTGPTPKEGNLLRSYHRSTVSQIALAPNGKRLLAAGGRGDVALWDLTGGQKLREWWLPMRAAQIVFSPDGRHVALGNLNGTVYVLRLPPPAAGPGKE